MVVDRDNKAAVKGITFIFQPQPAGKEEAVPVLQKRCTKASSQHC
jgi:hypothetical protein